MKNTRLMMTQPMGGSQGDIYQIAATVAELNAIYQVSWRTCHANPLVTPSPCRCATMRLDPSAHL
jgi:ATP-dependent protease ClpP protease subunit